MYASGSGFSYKRWLLLLVFLSASLVLYIPVLQNGFAADDFRAVYRAGVEGQIFGPGFFRPFSDITIFVTYVLFGLDPLPYHISNVILHGCSSFLLYLLALKLPFVIGQNKREAFAWFSSILFITYPFHNESIAWIVGRGSIIATFFGLLCMLVFVSKINPLRKYLYTGSLFFLGLLAYESILLLPFILLIISCKKERSKSIMAKWLLIFTLTLIIYFAVRYYIAGVVIGEYGHGIFSLQFQKYLVDFFKVMGRMLMPPSNKPILLTIIFSTLVTLYLGTWLIPIKMFSRRVMARKNELIIVFCLLLSLVIPVSFGISTRTSEGERLLYFPSVFFTLLIAYLFVESLAGKTLKLVAMASLLIFNIVFIQINNSYWVTASNISDEVLKQTIDIASSGNEIILVNVPGEYRGAFIFRNTFEEAMLLNKIDTQKVHVANYLNNAEYNSLPGKILPVIIADTVYFGRSAKMWLKRVSVVNYDKPYEPVQYIGIKDKTEIWFWDKHRFLRYN